MELQGFEEYGFNQNSVNQSLIGMVIEAAWRLGKKRQYKKQEDEARNTAIVMLRGSQHWSHRRSVKIPGHRYECQFPRAWLRQLPYGPGAALSYP